MARILIVGGGCRGRRLGAAMVGEGHAVRITTRSERGRAAIEAAGAECWVGDPDRLATLRGCLDGVAILCWLLATASGDSGRLHALHGTRLRLFLTQAIDTTVRGLLYELAGRGADGEPVVRELTARNSIPVAMLAAEPAERDAWLAGARAGIRSLLSGR